MASPSYNSPRDFNMSSCCTGYHVLSAFVLNAHHTILNSVGYSLTGKKSTHDLSCDSIVIRRITTGLHISINHLMLNLKATNVQICSYVSKYICSAMRLYSRDLVVKVKFYGLGTSPLRSFINFSNHVCMCNITLSLWLTQWVVFCKTIYTGVHL